MASSLVRFADPEGETPNLVVRPSASERESDERLLRAVKRILRNNRESVMKILRVPLTAYKERHEPSNAQTLLTPVGCSLSKAQREALGLDQNIPGARIYEVPVICEFCGQKHNATVICAPPSEVYE